MDSWSKGECVHSRRDFLRYVTAGGLACCFSGLLSGTGKASQSSSKPNVIFILADDLGWYELGCYGNTYNETPHLDALAAAGMRFTDGYASAPVCSPYRASLMTGQVPVRVGILKWLEGNDSKYLSRSYTTMAEQFKQAGYATGIVGKWHLSGYLQSGAPCEVPPTEHGFDENLVGANKYIANGSYWYPYSVIMNPPIPEIDPPLDPAYEDEYLVDRCNYEAVNFIERHKDKPFFLHLSHYAVHTILAGKPDLVSHFEGKPESGTGIWAPENNPHLAAQLYSIDEGVGQIVAKLQEHNLLDNTLIVFMGDNGGEGKVTTNGPLRDAKGTLYEGGIRVPLIMSWPGYIQAGSVCREPVVCCDFYPTFSELAQVPLPADQPMDGVSLTSLFIHLDASSLKGLRDGDTVNVWPDLATGDTIDGTVAKLGSNLLPTYKSDIVNGKPVVRFANAQVLGSSDFSWLDVDAGLTICVVLTGDSSGQTAERVFGIGDRTGAVGKMISFDASTTTDETDGGSGFRFNNGKALVRNGNPIDNDFHVVILQIDQGWQYQSARYYIDDMTAQTFDNVANGSNTLNLPSGGNTLTLGTSWINGTLGTSDMYSGDMAEIMVFNRLLSIEEMKMLQSCLHDKYFYSPIEASPGALSLEEGQTGPIAIRLNAVPTEDVLLTLEDSAEPDQLLFSPPSILFTCSSWDTAVSVQVAAQDDEWFESLHLTDIKISAQSADPQYQGISTKALVTIIDNECSTVNSPPEDLNFDCIVDISDVALLAKSWLWCDPMKNVMCHDLR